MNARIHSKCIVVQVEDTVRFNFFLVFVYAIAFGKLLVGLCWPIGPAGPAIYIIPLPPDCTRLLTTNLGHKYLPRLV